VQKTLQRHHQSLHFLMILLLSLLGRRLFITREAADVSAPRSPTIPLESQVAPALGSIFKRFQWNSQCECKRRSWRMV